MRKIFVLFFAVISLLCGIAFAKREAPKDVNPLERGGIRYTAPHWGPMQGRRQNGGYVEAWDIETGKMLWEMQVYMIQYNPKIEKDIQDVFITSLRIEGDVLIAENEAGDIFEIDLKTKMSSRR